MPIVISHGKGLTNLFSKMASALNTTKGIVSRGIRIYNNFLSKVEGCDINENLRNRMKAEARFFRAFDYLNMTLKFGKVPLITEVLAYDAPNVPRDSEESVRSFVLKELTEIAEVLPNSYSGGYLNETGRITRAAALALKARAALYFGDYKTAEEASGKIISEGHHSLFRITSLNAAQQQEAARWRHISTSNKKV